MQHTKASSLERFLFFISGEWLMHLTLDSWGRYAHFKFPAFPLHSVPSEDVATDKPEMDMRPNRDCELCINGVLFTFIHVERFRFSPCACLWLASFLYAFSWQRGKGGKKEGKTEEKEREWYCLCIAEDVTFSIDSRFSDWTMGQWNEIMFTLRQMDHSSDMPSNGNSFALITHTRTRTNTHARTRILLFHTSPAFWSYLLWSH